MTYFYLKSKACIINQVILERIDIVKMNYGGI